MKRKSSLALCALILMACAACTARAQTAARSAAGLAASGASGASSASGGGERAGTVKSVRGEVKLQSGSAPARPAVAGDPVTAVDQIQTGADSGASMVLRDGTALVVGPSSRLDLKDFKFDSTTQDGNMIVSLLRGSLRMVSGLIGKTHPEAVRVETPSAVIGIRGTDFIVETNARQ